jgi:hypothetical protein
MGRSGSKSRIRQGEDVISFPAIRHDILDFCERERVTLGGGGIEKKMTIIILGACRRIPT